MNKLKQIFDDHPLMFLSPLVVAIVATVFGVVNYYYNEKLEIINIKHELEISALKNELAKKINTDSSYVETNLNKTENINHGVKHHTTGTVLNNKAKAKIEVNLDNKILNDRINFANNFLKTYIDKYSSIDYKSSRKPAFNQAVILLDALESVALQISNKNEYLEFVYMQREHLYNGKNKGEVGGGVSH